MLPAAFAVIILLVALGLLVVFCFKLWSDVAELKRNASSETLKKLVDRVEQLEKSKP